MRFFLSFILVVSVLYSCKEDDSNTTIVNGQILDSQTNQPIESVTVTLQQEDLFVYTIPLQYMLTSSDGKFNFKFEWKEHHAYSLKASKIGYNFSNSVFLTKGIEQEITIKLVKESE